MQIICPHCQNAFDPDIQPQYVDASTQQNLVVCPQCAGEIQLGKTSASIAGTVPPAALHAAGASPGFGEQAAIDWESNWRSDFFSAYLRTVKGVITHPVEYTGSLPPSRDLLGMCVFAYVTILLTSIPITLFQILLTSLTEPSSRENMIGMIFGAVLGIMIGPFLALGGAFIFSGIFHLSYTYIGRSQKGYLTTATVTFYGIATNWVAVIPILGWFVQFIYGFILGIGAQARAHQIDPGRAALAYLLPIVICCCCLGLFYLTLGGLVLGALGGLGHFYQ